MSEPTYGERALVAYLEGREAGRGDTAECRYTPGTPMHGEWLEGQIDGERMRADRPDCGARSVGEIAREIVADVVARRVPA